MTKYADTVPQSDKQAILDLYYGKTRGKLQEPLDRWAISKKLNGKYTPSQIYSIIIDDMDKGGDNGQA